LKMYTVYCSNYDNALKTMENLSANDSSFQAWLKEALLNPELHDLTLVDLLVKPIQRICRYPLFLRELLKHTGNSHADYQNLTIALNKMESIVLHINEAKRNEENISKVVEIQSILTGFEDLITPTRRFIREGDLTELTSGKNRCYHYFLFNDLLLYGKSSHSSPNKKKQHLIMFKGKFDLKGWVVSALPDTKDMKNMFQIANLQSGQKVIFSSATSEEKEQWTEDLTKVVEKLFDIDSKRKKASKKSASINVTQNSATTSLGNNNCNNNVHSSRIALEESCDEHQKLIEELKKQIQSAKLSHEETRREKENLKEKINDIKQQLVNVSMDLIQLRQEVSPMSNGRERSQSCNKKVIYDMQDISRQLSNEKRLQKEMEKWKNEYQKKLIDLNKQIADEISLQKELRETYGRLQNELNALKSSTA